MVAVAEIMARHRLLRGAAVAVVVIPVAFLAGVRSAAAATTRTGPSGPAAAGPTSGSGSTGAGLSATSRPHGPR